LTLINPDYEIEEAKNIGAHNKNYGLWPPEVQQEHVK